MKGDDSGTPRSGGLARSAAQRARDTETAASNADQSASDVDQTLSDADQEASERDEHDAASDQVASDEDQASADRQRRLDADGPAAAAYEASRRAREGSTIRRLASHADRAMNSRSRVTTGEVRDATALDRDEVARRHDDRAEALEQTIVASDAPIVEKFERLRVRAAADRKRAAQDRAAAAAERARLEAELHSAHLDGLTGAYRREMGTLALDHEIERARRAEGRFVLAFVDVDGMKQVNDSLGHAAGDHVLQTLVWHMRSNIRPFDPVVRYGGDEFVVGLGGIRTEEAARRFAAIDRSVRDEMGVGISVGLAELEPGETLEALMARADDALLEARSKGARDSRGRR
jgi:diguanylate cyclase (GGDEF)-like protein